MCAAVAAVWTVHGNTPAASHPEHHHMSAQAFACVIMTLQPVPSDS